MLTLLRHLTIGDLLVLALCLFVIGFTVRWELKQIWNRLIATCSEALQQMQDGALVPDGQPEQPVTPITEFQKAQWRRARTQRERRATR